MKITVSNPTTNNKISAERIVDGVIVLNEKNPEYASIAYEGVAFVNNGNFLAKQKRVVFQTAELEDLKEYVAAMGLKAGQVVTGQKMIVKEQHTPFFEGQEPKINPQTGEILTKAGKEIYRQTFLVAETSEENDAIVEHDRAPVASKDEFADAKNVEAKL